MSRLELLEEQVLPEAVLDGAFGENVELIKCDVHESAHGEDEFASIVVYSSMTIKMGNEIKELRLVVKFNQESEIFRKSVSTDSQFQNEVFMYEHFFPFLRMTENTVPKFYYGIATGGVSPAMDVVILEDLCREDYHTKKGSLDLDYDHTLVALQQLARLHATSYIAKHKEEDTFFEKNEYLREAQWVSERSVHINISLTTVVKKVMNILLAGETSDAYIKCFMDKMIDPVAYIQTLLDPNEPVSVVCHGDFCANNILFKYNENGIPIHAKFVDFGTVRYGSPIIDLSFFLFFNTTSELRRARLDDLMTEYYSTLKSSSANAPVPQIEVFEAEFHKRAVYGFLDCCVQIPLALSEPTDWEELALLSIDDLHTYYDSRCTQQASDLLCDIFRDLVYFKCSL